IGPLEQARRLAHRLAVALGGDSLGAGARAKGAGEQSRHAPPHGSLLLFGPPQRVAQCADLLGAVLGAFGAADVHLRHARAVAGEGVQPCRLRVFSRGLGGEGAAVVALEPPGEERHAARLSGFARATLSTSCWSASRRGRAASPRPASPLTAAGSPSAGSA